MEGSKPGRPPIGQDSLPSKAKSSRAALALGAMLIAPLGIAFGLLMGAARGFLPAKLWPLIWRTAKSKAGIAFIATCSALAFGAFLWRQHTKPIEWAALDWRAGLSLGGAALSFGALRWATRKPWLEVSFAALLGLGLLFAGFNWGNNFEVGEEALLRVGSETTLSSKTLLKTRTLFDGDGDGFPTALCRADCDCDDANTEIHTRRH